MHLGQFLATVQWRVRPATLLSAAETPVYDELQVNTEPCEMNKFKHANRQSRAGKSCTAGGLPGEFSNALEQEDSSELTVIFDFINECWAESEATQQWKTAAISMLFKKGNLPSRDNYCPVSICQHAISCACQSSSSDFSKLVQISCSGPSVRIPQSISSADASSLP